MLDSIKLILHHLLPKKCLTKLVGYVAEKRAGWLTKTMINLFIWLYRVDISDIHNFDITKYRTFNDFFSRPLQENARLIDTNPNLLVLPADGTISQMGHIEGNSIFQAKGHHYSLEALLAGDRQMEEQFYNGEFVTTYLAPRDYHRVHMPCNGILREMIYVPGDLYSVNSITTQNIKNLFARNERVICYFDTEFGPIAQIMIGAIIIGSIETVWFGTVTPPREGIIKRWSWPDSNTEGSVVLLKGQEMGRFKLGSTVINLFTQNRIKIMDNLKPKTKVRFGQPMAMIFQNNQTETVIRNN